MARISDRNKKLSIVDIPQTLISDSDKGVSVGRLNGLSHSNSSFSHSHLRTQVEDGIYLVTSSPTEMATSGMAVVILQASAKLEEIH